MVPMPIRFACPQCKKEFRAKDSLAGKKVKCTGCGNVIQVPSAAPASSPEATPAPPAPPKPAPRKKPQPESEEYQLVFEEEEQKKPQTVGAPKRSAGGGVICPGCNKEYPAGTKICIACGVNLVTGEKIQTQFVREEEPAVPSSPAAVLPGEEQFAQEEQEKAPPGEEMPFFKLVLNMFIHPIRTMQELFVYLSSWSMLYKMLGFYFATLVILGLVSVLQGQIGAGAQAQPTNIAGINIPETARLLIPAIIALGVVAHLIRTLLWAVVLSITGMIFGSGGKGNFLPTFIALAFVYSIGNCVEAVVVGGVSALALIIGPVVVLPMAFILIAVPFYRAFLFILAVKEVYDLSWWMTIIFIVVAYVLIYWLLMSWIGILLLFIFAPGA
jgi:predicted Zn finger-like uncharacterized protein